MKVRELIKVLEEFDPELPVVIESDNGVGLNYSVDCAVLKDGEVVL